MAEVYLARQAGPDGFEKLVAVKRVLRTLSQDNSFVRALLNEARTAADLRHPNVVQIFEVGRDKGVPFIAMEFLHGQDLAVLLRSSQERNNPIPTGVAAQIVLDCARGLYHAHVKKDLAGRPLSIVHRDVSPHNIFVTYDGTTKLVDFGIARAESPDVSDQGDLRGKLRYMSPERLNLMPIDARSDQFSLGIVLYELTTNKPLFDGMSSAAIVRTIKACRFRPPSAVTPGYAPALEKIVMRMLSQDPGARFEDCAEVASAVELFLEREHIPHSVGRVGEYLQDLFAEELAEPLVPPDVPLELEEDEWEDDETTVSTPLSGLEDDGVRTPGNLPEPDEPFIGRGGDLEGLHRTFQRGERLVTLMGTPGSGKTRLAIEFARLAQDDFPGGAWFIDLSEARSIDDVLAAAAAVLDVPVSEQANVRQAVDQLGHAIAARERTLLILDNFEQVAEHAPATLGRWYIQAPQALFLTTSRGLLRVQAEVFSEVGPLSLPTSAANARQSEAVRLFADRARAARPGFKLDRKTTNVVTEIVKRLDGLPLAIELAAARMEDFSATQLLNQLKKRIEVVDEDRTAASRQATLKGAIDWSWQLLEAWEKDTLAQISVFRGGFMLAQAEKVIDLSAYHAPALAEVLEGLISKSLMRSRAPDESPNDVRYDTYNSIREYAANQLKEAGEAEPAVDRHADTFLHAGEGWLQNVDRHGGARVQRRIALERENFVALVVRQLARPPAPESVGRALRGLLALFPVISARGPLHRAQEWFDSALRATEDVELDALLHARGLDARARIQLARGEPQAARQDFEWALDLVRGQGGGPLEGDVLCRLSGVEQILGHVDRAEKYAGEALQIHRETKSRAGEAEDLLNLGTLMAQRGSIEDAVKHLERSLGLFRKLGDKGQEGVVLSHRASLLVNLGRLKAAEEDYAEALTLHEEMGDRRFEGVTTANLGLLYQEQGDLKRARAKLEEAIQVMRSLGDRRFSGVFTVQLATLDWEDGRLDKARGGYERGLEILREVEDRRQTGIALSYMGAVEAALGQLDKGNMFLDAAEQIIHRVNDPILLQLNRLLRGHLDLARAWEAQQSGDDKAAERLRSQVEDRISAARAPQLSTRGREPSASERSDEVRKALRLLGQALSVTA